MNDPTPEDPMTLLPGEEVVVGTPPPRFEDELRALINRHSVENWSDTPDFILVTLITNVLIDYADAVKARDKWYGEVKP